MGRFGEWDPPQCWHRAVRGIMNLPLRLLQRQREGGRLLIIPHSKTLCLVQKRSLKCSKSCDTVLVLLLFGKVKCKAHRDINVPHKQVACVCKEPCEGSVVSRSLIFSIMVAEVLVCRGISHTKWVNSLV